MKIALVRSKFNEEITIGLQRGALKALREESVAQKNIKAIEVPGAWEIPVMVEKLAYSKKYKAIIALGAVIKGKTNHDYWINSAVFPALQEIARKYLIPITLGIITCRTWKQAKDRSADNSENRGYVAAKAALDMI